MYAKTSFQIMAILILVITICTPGTVEALPAGVYFTKCDPADGHVVMINALGKVVAILPGPCPAETYYGRVVIDNDGNWTGSYGVGADPFYDPPDETVGGKTALETVNAMNATFVPVDPNLHPTHTVPGGPMPTLNASQSHFVF